MDLPLPDDFLLKDAENAVVSEKATKFLHEVLASHNKVREAMLKAVMEIRNDHFKDMSGWDGQSMASRGKWIENLFNSNRKFRAPLKINEVGGMKQACLTKLKLTVKYALLYAINGKPFPIHYVIHLSNDSRSPNERAIKEVYEAVKEIKGSAPLEMKIHKVITSLKDNPASAVGKVFSGKEAKKKKDHDGPILSAEEKEWILPNRDNFSQSQTKAWACSFLKATANWSQHPCLGGSTTHLDVFASASRDTRLKKIADALLMFRSLLEQFTPVERGETLSEAE